MHSPKRGLKKKITEAGDGTQNVGVTWNELEHLNEETGQALIYVPTADRRRLMAVQARVVKFFEAELGEIFEPKPPKELRRHLTKTDFVYQFKITLLDIKPPIWRRIQVSDCTLLQFHEYIQAAFGWENYHLHEFEINGVRYSEPAPDGDDFGMEFVDETDVLLSNLLSKSAKRAPWIYEYDFGGSWKHEVVFEGPPINDPKLQSPVCLDGERACPPEDCGGPWGYADYLDAIADPQHECHDEMLEWRGPFDPEAFDLKKATREMRKVKR